jgi:hypothetical protein
MPEISGNRLSSFIENLHFVLGGGEWRIFILRVSIFVIGGSHSLRFDQDCKLLNIEYEYDLHTL